jgi:hypothetical protein
LIGLIAGRRIPCTWLWCHHRISHFVIPNSA